MSGECHPERSALTFWLCLLCPEQRKHVVFGSETEEGDSIEYEVDLKVADTNDKEDEFKKVFAVG